MTELAKNGWPFPKGATQIEKALISNYAPITQEFTARLAAARAKKGAAVEQIRAATASNQAADVEYQTAIRELNEWRKTLPHNAVVRTTARGE